MRALVRFEKLLTCLGYEYHHISNLLEDIFKPAVAFRIDNIRVRLPNQLQAFERRATLTRIESCGLQVRHDKYGDFYTRWSACTQTVRTLVHDICPSRIVK